MTSSSDRWAAAGDAELLGDLRRVLADADPVPGFVLESARGAFSMRALDAELAELLTDSAAESGVSLDRAARGVRLLSFATAGGEVEVDMQVESVGDRRNLVGQLLGAVAGSLTIDSPGGSTVVGLDEAGLFSARGVANGMVRLRCTSAHGQPVATSWVLL